MYTKLELKELLLEKGYTVGYANDSKGNPFLCVQRLVNSETIQSIDLDILTGYSDPVRIIEQIYWFEENRISR